MVAIRSIPAKVGTGVKSREFAQIVVVFVSTPLFVNSTDLLQH